jgi:hypothetical protein
VKGHEVGLGPGEGVGEPQGQGGGPARGRTASDRLHRKAWGAWSLASSPAHAQPVIRVKGGE